MDSLLPYTILIISFIGLVFFLKGFPYKQIFLLVLGGGLLLIFLQFIYISFGKEFNVNFFFIKGNFEVNNYIRDIESYFNKSEIHIGGLGLFSLFFSLIIPATLEELGKFFFFKKIAASLGILKSIASCTFAIIYVAIGFAFFETAAYIYFLSAQPGTDVVTITIVRTIISTLSHILFSAIIGYYFGKALFMKYELIDNLEISKTTKLLKKLRHIPFIHIHSISRYYAIRYIITGFFLSIFLHTVYNFFMSTGNEIFAIFTVLIGIALFVKIITMKKCNKNYLALKNKIAYLQEMKALKEKMRSQSTIKAHSAEQIQ
ncbi:MAG: PrsW family glutamic-type intramembrane protease [Candidatus Gracilibacteria bacterium]|nr:PrsW family glutamic-type intramembrane protease [Candidatus Gracilibacteria bacterium]